MRFYLGRQRLQISPDRPLVFIHFFRSAGTSVHDYLCSAFPKAAIYPGRHVEDFERIVPGYSVYSGHMYLRQWSNAPVKPYFITWLRDPVARVTSAYYYIASLDPQHMAETTSPGWIEKTKRMNFSAFAATQDNDVSLAAHNSMCRFLYPNEADEQSSQSRKARLGKRALWRFAFIGIAERSDHSMNLLAKRFGLPPPSREFRSNSYIENSGIRGNNVAQDQPLTSDIAATIKRYNAADTVLYDRGRLLSSLMS